MIGRAYSSLKFESVISKSDESALPIHRFYYDDYLTLKVSLPEKLTPLTLMFKFNTADEI